MRIHSWVLLGALVSMRSSPSAAQVPDIFEQASKAAAQALQNESEEAPPSPKPRQLTAKLDKDVITLSDGRKLTLEYKNRGLPWPQLEMTGPVGAKVTIYVESRKVHEAEVPFTFKKLAIDKYIKLEVVEPAGAWTLKLKPKEGHVTLIKAPEQPKSGSCKALLIEQDYDASLLPMCQGVDEVCAVALLSKEWPPQELRHCKLGVPSACARRVLDEGHHPQLVGHCKGVTDDACVEALLERGDPPSALVQCR